MTKYKLFKEPSNNKEQYILKKLKALEVKIISTFKKLTSQLNKNQSIENINKIQKLIETSKLQLQKIHDHIKLISR